MPISMSWLSLTETLAISDIVIRDVTETSAIVEWETNRPSQGWVEYGEDDGGPYPDETNRETSFDYDHHVQSVTGLTAATDYFFVIQAVDAQGEEATSAQRTFTTTGAAVVADYPPIDTFRNIPNPVFTVPNLLQTVAIPELGTEMIRVNPTVGVAHAYSTRSAFSALDPTTGRPKWLGLFQGSPKVVLNGDDYSVADSSGVDPGGGFQWSNTNPDLGFAFGAPSGSNPAKMRFYGMVANNWTLIKSIDLIDPVLGTPVPDFRLGGGYGAQSLDDTRWVGNYKRANGWHGVMSISIDPVAMTATVVRMRDLILDAGAGVSQRFGSIHVSPDGRYVYASARGPGTLYHFDDLTTIAQITTSDRHHDVQEFSDGTQVLAMVGRNATGTSGGNGIGYYEMANGTYHQVLPGPFPSAHISGRAVLVPGHVVLSSHDTGSYPGEATVFSLDLETGDCRYYGFCTPDDAYDAETQACAAPDMSVVVYVVNSTTSIYSIVAGMDVIA